MGTLQCATGKSARATVEGEYHSASAIDAVVPNLVPKAVGWGEYFDGEATVYFFLGDFHDLDFSASPDPSRFTSQIAKLHRTGVSPTGMFGFPVLTVIGKMERTVTWEKNWAKSFIHQLRDAIKYDNETNGSWPELAAACSQLIEVVIPRLLGALQSDGRGIKPSLIHGDLWEWNIGIDKQTGKPSSSTLEVLTPTMRWNSEHGDALGPNISTCRLSCNTTKAILKLRNPKMNGTTEIDYTASIRI